MRERASEVKLTSTRGFSTLMRDSLGMAMAVI